jgi:hypothetical protein
MAGAFRIVLLLGAAANLGGCYYQVMAGPAVATADSTRAGGMVTASTGLNGELGGVGLLAGATLLDGQYTGTVGAEAFRVWRSQSLTGLQPFARAALGALEVGSDGEELLLGGLSPRAEAGLMWLGEGLEGVTLSAAAEYRPRLEGPSTPIFWLQIGFGGFDFLDSGAPRAPPRGRDD